MSRHAPHGWCRVGRRARTGQIESHNAHASGTPRPPSRARRAKRSHLAASTKTPRRAVRRARASVGSGRSRTLAVEGITTRDPLLRDAVDDAALDEHARPLEGLGRDGRGEVVGAVALDASSTVGCERLKATAMKKRKPHRARRAAPRASARGFGRVRVSAPMFQPESTAPQRGVSRLRQQGLWEAGSARTELCRAAHEAHGGGGHHTRIAVGVLVVVAANVNERGRVSVVCV